MATTIKIKQIDLQGILSASSQVDLLSASNYTSFVNQLDTTMSSDAELAAVSSSISQSIYAINQTLGSSLVSSSSQLTSSFDERYILSGSIPSIPTESFATTGSNIFIGNQTISGSLVVSQIISNNAPTVGDNVVAGETGITYSGRIAIFREDAFSVGVWTDVQIGWTVTDNNGFTDTIASIGGFGVASFVTNVNDWPSPASGKTYVFTSPDYQQGYINSITISVGDNDWIFDKDTGLTFPDETIQTTAFIPTTYVTTSSFNEYTSSQSTSSLVDRLNTIESETGSYLTSLNGTISGSSQLTSSFDTRYTLSGSVVSGTTPAGTISGSAQISAFGFVSSSQTINTSSLATTGSNTFYGDQTISGSIELSDSIKGTSDLPIIISSSATIGALTFDGTNYLTLSPGIVVGSGAYTAETFVYISDYSGLRYVVLAASTPGGSGFSFGILSTNQIFVDRDGVSSNVYEFSSTFPLNQWYHIAITKNGAGQETAFVNGVKSISSYGSNVNYSGTTEAIGRFNESVWLMSGSLSQTRLVVGSNVYDPTDSTIDVPTTTLTNVSNTQLLLNVATAGTYLDDTSGNQTITNNNSVTFNSNGPLSTESNVEFTFGQNGTFVFPDGTIQSTAFTGLNHGIVSGSSQLTSSYDARYTLSGSVQPLPSGLFSSSAQLPSGIVSGSSQLTSSFDTRYTLSGSLTAGSNVSVSDTAPTSPTEGDLWWKSNDGNLYVYYDSYWIVATDTISAIPNGVISGSAQITTLGFVSGSYETTGRGIISGSAQLPSGLISGSTQLTTSFPSKTTGTWTVPAGASTQSFTVDAGGSYTMWVSGNIPNGIISWNATVTTSNTNVPVIGSQFGWYYVDGNALVLTSIPDQIIGTNGGIISSPSSYPPNTSNVFKFGITNNSGTTQTINYGYIKLS